MKTVAWSDYRRQAAALRRISKPSAFGIGGGSNWHTRRMGAGMEAEMLNLTLKAGDYVAIGEDIKVVFTGGSSKHIRIMVEAPKEMNVVRGEVLRKMTGGQEQPEAYFVEPKMAQKRFDRILAGQRKTDEQQQTEG